MTLFLFHVLNLTFTYLKKKYINICIYSLKKIKFKNTKKKNLSLTDSIIFRYILVTFYGIKFIQSFKVCVYDNEGYAVWFSMFDSRREMTEVWSEIDSLGLFFLLYFMCFFMAFRSLIIMLYGLFAVMSSVTEIINSGFLAYVFCFNTYVLFFF